MTTQTFTWTPSTGFSVEHTPRVSKAKFGDGYSQRTRYGINTVDIAWNLTFVNQSISKAKEIVDFLTYHGGTEYFYFIPYFNVHEGETSTTYKVICSEWSVEYTSPISKTITAKFEKVNDIT